MADHRSRTSSNSSGRGRMTLENAEDMLANMQQNCQEMAAQVDRIRRESDNKTPSPEPRDDHRRLLPTRNTTAARHRQDRTGTHTPEIVNDQLHDRHGFFRHSKLPSPGYIGQARRETRGEVDQSGLAADFYHGNQHQHVSQDSPPIDRRNQRYYPTATSTPPWHQRATRHRQGTRKKTPERKRTAEHGIA